MTRPFLPALLLLVFEIGAAAAPPDDARSAWRYRRSVIPPAGGPGFAALALSPEVGARSQPELRDLRLLDSRGREVPYVVDQQAGGETSESATGTLVDTRSEKKLRTVWTVDLGKEVAFDGIDLTINDNDFAKRADIEAAPDRDGPWRAIARDRGLFDRLWDGTRVHHTMVELPAAEKARFLRIAVDDRGTAPIALTGAGVTRTPRSVPGVTWQREPRLLPQQDADRASRYRLDLPAAFPMDRVELLADDLAFVRRVELLQGEGTRPSATGEVLGAAELYRFAGAEQLAFSVKRPQAGPLYLVIRNADSPPLRRVRLRIFGTAARLLFPVPGPGPEPGIDGAWTLYYGNGATRAPSYDLELLKDRLERHPQLLPAQLGDEAANPAFRPVPPLGFVAGSGAELERAGFRYRRRLQIEGGEDLYSLMLQPADLAVAHPDLGDLRIADPHGRQVPYVLEAEAAQRAVPLRVERQSSGPPRTSVYQLTPTDLPHGGIALGLPVRAVELDVRERFFSRPLRLFPEARQPLLYSGEIGRRGDEGPELPVRVALPAGAARYPSYRVEVDDGDNAPLSLWAARGITDVPRLSFKLEPVAGVRPREPAPDGAGLCHGAGGAGRARREPRLTAQGQRLLQGRRVRRGAALGRARRGGAGAARADAAAAQGEGGLEVGAQAEVREEGQAGDARLLVELAPAVDQVLGVLLVVDVLQIEVDAQAPAAEAEGLVDAQVELVEVRQPRGPGRAVDRHVALRRDAAQRAPAWSCRVAGDVAEA